MRPASNTAARRLASRSGGGRHDHSQTRSHVWICSCRAPRQSPPVHRAGGARHRGRQEAKDPRPALAERYRGYDDYERRYMEAAERLVSQRYLLAEDLPRLKALCQRFKATLEAALKER